VSRESQAKTPRLATRDSRLTTHDSRLVFRQTTLRAPVCVSGVGMHSGAESRVTIHPAPAGAGVQFFSGAVRIPARAAFVVSTARCTSLGRGEARIDTVEHLLSALYGLGVDNAEIVVEGPEIPILDGSALPWVGALLGAGIKEMLAEGRAPGLSAPVVLRDGDSWLVAAPAGSFSVTCVTQFDHPLLGTQAATFSADPARYAAEIAPARTFGFAAEVEALRKAGLARGGSLDNALIVYGDHFSDALRVPDECLRHKALDLLGDLSLAGGRIHAAVTAIKPGHRINTAFAAMLSEQLRVDS
jgi:UDP-3-O-[3-hydroxymyristoyl] N-acetylglucosamine deacetylase